MANRRDRFRTLAERKVDSQVFRKLRHQRVDEILHGQSAAQQAHAKRLRRQANKKAYVNQVAGERLKDPAVVQRRVDRGNLAKRLKRSKVEPLPDFGVSGAGFKLVDD